MFSLFFIVGNVEAASLSHELRQQEIEYYDEQIQALTNLRDYYCAKAVRYRNRANHFEYQNGSDSIKESKKLKAQAEEYETIVSRIEEELVKLQEKRETLVGKNSSPSPHS
jgi:hypothetical protein